MLRNLCSAALVAVMLVIFVAGNVQAQTATSANATVSVQANVVTAITITKNVDVSFGGVGSTSAGLVFVDPQGLANTNVGAAATPGRFTIGGANATSIRIAWPATVAMTGPAALTYTLKVTGHKLSANQATSTDLTGTNPATVTIAAAGDAVPGAYFLWVGGDLGTLSGQTAGSYTGTANFTVEYN